MKKEKKERLFMAFRISGTFFMLVLGLYVLKYIPILNGWE